MYPLLISKKQIFSFRSSINKYTLVNSFFKDEFFFFKLNRNFIVRNFSTSFCLKLPMLKEQTEKTFIFFHDDLWDEEDWFRSRYCLRIMFALKKYRENNPQAALPNALIDANIVRKYIKLMLAYLKNTLVNDLDRINSKFLVFFYFLTKINYLAHTYDKKKLILKNLFFAFFFSRSRLDYFFNVTNMNPMISKNYIKFKHRLRYVTSVFPHGFFLLLYSPYKSSFNFSSSNLILSRQIVFFKRLFYLKNLLNGNPLKHKRSKNFNYFLVYNKEKYKSFNSSGLLKKIKTLNKKFFRTKNFLNLHEFKSKKKKRILQTNSKLSYVKVINFVNKKKSAYSYFFYSSFNTNFLLEPNQNKMFRKNLLILQKILRRIICKKINRLKLNEARLFFYFRRYSPKDNFVEALQFMEKSRDSSLSLYKFLNRALKISSSNYFKHSNIFFFLRKMFRNFDQTNLAFSFLDSYYLRLKKRKKIIKVIRKRLKVNLAFISKELKASVIKNSQQWLNRISNKTVISKIKKLDNKLFFIFQLNFSSNFFEMNNLLYQNIRTSVGFLLNLSKFLNEFQFTLKFFIFKKVFSISKFLKSFSSFVNLFYLLSNSLDSSSIFSAFRCFPFFYYFSSNLDKFNIRFANKSKFQYILKRLSTKFKFFLQKKVFNRLDVIDFELKTERNSKKKKVNLSFLRKNLVQEYIIGRQNLRNLESFTDSIKRFVKRLKYLPKKTFKSILALSSSVPIRKNLFKRNKIMVKKKKQIKKTHDYKISNILNTQHAKLKYEKYKRNLKRYKMKRIRNLAIMRGLRTHIDPIEFFIQPYFYRFIFMKNITRLEFKRYRKRFFINVLFFNKFLKEKRIATMYHKMLKGSRRISVFHKLTNPFFLRLKLKRLSVFISDKITKIINRFSFLNCSSFFKAFFNKLSYFSFFHFKFIPNEFSENYKSLQSFFRNNFLLFSHCENGLSVIKAWLNSFKHVYFSSLLQFQFNSKLFLTFNSKLYDYLVILKFFFFKKIYFFKKTLHQIFSDFFAVLNFFNKLKNFFFNIITFSQINSSKHYSKKYFSLNHHIFYNVLNYNFNKNVRNYSTTLVVSSTKLFFSINSKRNKVFRFFFSLKKIPFNKFNNSLTFCYLYFERFLNNNKNTIFKKFLSLYSLDIFVNRLSDQVDEINLSLQLQNFRFSKKFDYLKFFPFFFSFFFNSKGLNFHFSEFNVKNLVLKNFIPFKSFFAIGFFTFFYSSLRTSYAKFSNFVYSALQKKRKRKGKLKLNKFQKFHRKDRRVPFMVFQKYSKTAKYRNSLYYLSSKRRIFKGLRFSKPNSRKNRFFKYYFFFRFKPKKERKRKLKNIKVFRLPYSRRKRKFLKPKSKIFNKYVLGKKNLKFLKNLPSKSPRNLYYPFYLVKFFKKKKFLNFSKSSLTNFLKYDDFKQNFFKFPFKKGKINPKTQKKINSESSFFSSKYLTSNKLLFASTIFTGSLLNKRIKKIQEKFRLDPFKKLFYFDKYFEKNFTFYNKENSFMMFNVISKYSKIYSFGLSKINYVFLNIRFQRFLRLLFIIYNQKKIFFANFNNYQNVFSIVNNSETISFQIEQLFFFTYLDIFSFSQFSVNLIDISYFLNSINFHFSQNNELSQNFYELELSNIFFFDEKCVISDEFFWLCNTLIFSSNVFFKNPVFDSLYWNFFEESPVLDFQINFNNDSFLSFSNCFLSNSEFIIPLLKLYIYVLNFSKHNYLTNMLIPLKFLISEFSLSFLNYLKSFNFVRIVKKNKRKYLLFRDNFFYFLNNLFSFFFIKFFNFKNLTYNSKILAFIINLFLSTFKFNSHNINNFLFNLFKDFKGFFFINFSKISIIKLKIKKFKSLILNILEKKKKNDNFFSNYNFGIYYKKNFKKHKHFKNLKKVNITTIIRETARKHKKIKNNIYKSKLAGLNKDKNVSEQKLSIFNIDSCEPQKFKIFHFLRNKKLNKFFILKKWLNRKFRFSLVFSFLKKNSRPKKVFFRRKLRRRLKKFLFQKFYTRMYDFKLKTDRTFYHLFLMRKARSMQVFRRSKESIRVYKNSDQYFNKISRLKYFQKNRLEPLFKRLMRPFRLANRVRLTKRHLFIKSKFHPVIKQKIFMGFFFSPRFFNFKNVSNASLFFHFSLSSNLKQKLSLFLRLHRFLEFITRLIFKIKLYLRKKTNRMGLPDQFFLISKFFSLDSFSVILKIYRKIKLLIKDFFVKLSKYIRRKRGSKDIDIIRSKLNYNLSNIRFMFFYNFLSSKFLKFFILRYFFFGDYLKLRFQFINRYLWFRTIPLNSFLLTPKVYIIITKLRNNFFLTAIDLYGRILYKSSPGIVKFTGSDKMSKYAWFEASLDFFDGFLEFFRYFLKSKKKKKVSYSGIRLDREYNLRYNYKKTKFSAFLHPSVHYLFEKRKFKKKSRKRRAKLKVRLRRFFVISKGASDFNVRIFLKGMVYERFYVSRYFAGAVNYPMRSFSLCRIKKVRRR